MARGRKKHRHFRRHGPPGSAPGSIHVAPDAKTPTISTFSFDNVRAVEQTVHRVGDLRGIMDKWPVTWINVDGLGDAAVLSELASLFHIHPLAMEDVVHTHQRPKVEQYNGQLFVVMRMFQCHERLETEQVSIFLGKNYVLTFQENLPGDSFEPVRERLRSHGPLTSQTSDYLAYRLLDAIIDGYFPVLETYGEQIDVLEDEVLECPQKQTLSRIHDIKKDLLEIRRAIWPAREAVNQLARDPILLISDNTRVFLRDCYDHTVQLIDLLETYRDLSSDLRDLYLSSAGNRLNEIMKVLTIISTVFIPLTFVAGVYGMNFNTGASPYNMPELNWRFGYVGFWVAMLVIFAAELGFFWRKGWIGASLRKRFSAAPKNPNP